MEHEFWYEGRRPIARLPLEQQAFGPWLTDELGNNRTRISTLLDVIEQLLSGAQVDYRWQGREMVLILNREEAEVIAHTLLQDEDDVLDEPDLDLHDSDQQGGCGLEDFQDLLLAWQAFISG